MAKQSKIVLLAIVVLIFNRCANQLGPGGGEVDRIPPQIIETIPQNGTTNYKENYFEVTFSEWVEKRSVQEAIFISPRIEKGLEFDWSGRTLTVNFNDTLKQNTTYIITIGAEVQDINNRNKMAEPVTFSFSTGAQIDSGKISGKIYSDDPSGMMVFAYMQNDSIGDPMKNQPDFISQVGANGKYTLLGLANGNYNVYAIRDKFRDFIYQRNDDEYGVQAKELVLSDSVTKIANADFFISIEDTIPPSISNVFMRDRNHFLVEFSEPIDTSKVTSTNFYLFDSTSSLKILPKYFFRGDAKNNQFYLALSDSLIPDNDNYLFSENLSDKTGNLSKLQNNLITVKNDKDTTVPKILTIGGKMPDAKVDYDLPVIEMKFNDGFDGAKLKEAVVVADSKNENYNFEINKHDDSWFDIRIIKKLKPRTDYILKIDLNFIADAAGNKVDSIYQHKFTTVNDLDFSGVSGLVESKDTLHTFVVLQSLEKEKKVYKEKVDTKKNFNIQKVLPGKYLLWSFKDRNKIYDIGKIQPFKYSEDFTFYPDTLNLRARWPVGDVKVEYK